jgi:hypothetical protein
VFLLCEVIEMMQKKVSKRRRKRKRGILITSARIEGVI